MDIHQLEILDRLVAFGSLKKAASECYVSTSTLSRQIDAMENEVGFRIFTRSPYGISLTDQGQIFYDQTRSIPLLYESAVSNARTSQPDRQIIKVGVFSYDRRQITKLCEMIEKDVHSIDFSFISCRVSDMHATLLNRKVDLSLLTVLENEDDRFFSLPLFKASNAVIVSDDHPLAKRDQITLHELDGQTILINLNETRKQNMRNMRHLFEKLCPHIKLVDLQHPDQAEALCQLKHYLISTIEYLEPPSGCKMIPIADAPKVQVGTVCRKEDMQYFLPIMKKCAEFCDRAGIG